MSPALPARLPHATAALLLLGDKRRARAVAAAARRGKECHAKDPGVSPAGIAEKKQASGLLKGAAADHPPPSPPALAIVFSTTLSARARRAVTRHRGQKAKREREGTEEGGEGRPQGRCAYGRGQAAPMFTGACAALGRRQRVDAA